MEWYGEKTQTDIITLLESLKCNSSNSNHQRQILTALATILNSGEECQDYFREAGGVDEITRQLFDDGYALSSVPVALLCLANAIDDNEASKMEVLSTDLLSHLHSIFASNESKDFLHSAAFCLACLVSGNVKAQLFAYQSGCVEDLLQILRKLAQEECMDEAHWKMITRSVCACISNPRNENNQRISSCIIPHLLKVVNEWSDGNIVHHAISTIGIVIHNNVSNQKLFGSCGGIDALSCVISKLEQKSNADEQLNALISAITTLDFAVDDNQQNAARAIYIGIVPQVFSLLQHNQLSIDDMAFPLMLLTHILENTDLPVVSSTLGQCKQRMTKLLSDTRISQDDRTLKLIKYILAICKDRNIDNGREKHTVEKNYNKKRSNTYQTSCDGEEMPQPAFKGGSRNIMSEQCFFNKNSEFTFGNIIHENMLKGRCNSLNMGNERHNDQGLSCYNGIDGRAGTDISHDKRMRHEDRDYFSKAEKLKQLFEKHAVGRIGELDTPVNCNSNLQEQYQYTKQSLDGSLTEVNTFMNGMKNHSDNLEVPTMLAVMSLQEKQIKMFSQIQSLMSNIMSRDVEENTPPLQPGDSQPSLRKTQPSSLNASLIPNSSKYDLNRDVDKEMKFHDANQGMIKSKENYLQNISGISNASICKTLKGKKSLRGASPSRVSLYGLMNHGRVKKSGKPRLPGSTKSNFPHGPLSGDNSNYIAEESKQVKTTEQIKNRIYGMRADDKTSGDMLNIYNLENEYDNDNSSIMSTSTVDYTQSLYSILNENEDRKQMPPETPSKRSLSCINSLKDLDINRQNNYHNQSKTLQKPQHENFEESQLLHDEETSKNEKVTQNVRKVKSIRSIQLTTQADVLGEDSSSLAPSLCPRKRIPRENGGLDNSFESAIRSLSVCENKGLSRKRICNSNGESFSSVNQDRQETARTLWKKHIAEDMDSGFGPDSDHNLEKKSKCQNTALDASNNNCLETIALCGNNLGSHIGSNTQNIMAQISKANDTRMSGRVDLHKSAGRVFHSLTESIESEERKDFKVPSSFNATPRPLRMVNRNVRKRMAATINEDRRENMTKEISPIGSTTHCKEDIQKAELKTEEFKVPKKSYLKRSDSKVKSKSGLLDVKKDEDVYHFPSCSEMVDCVSSSDSDFSLTSIARTAKKRSQRRSRSKSNGPTRRTRVPYSDQEVLNLRHGVAIHGTRWQHIIAIYDFHPSRNAVDLKEKFKRLMAPPKHKNKPDEKCVTLPFSVDEIKRLNRGVKMFGHNWKAILAGERFLPGRTHHDLRNKWRSLSGIFLKDEIAK